MTDQEIIAGFKKRQPAAVNYVYKNFRPAIIQHLGCKGMDVQDAQDIFQDAVEAELSSRAKKALVLHSASYLTYFKVICNNLYLNHCRKNKRNANVTPEELTLPGMEATIERELQANDFRKIIERGLAKLDAGCRHIISLKLIRLESNETIARLLGITVVNARQKASRCRRKLAKFIAGDPDYQEMNEK